MLGIYEDNAGEKKKEEMRNKPEGCKQERDKDRDRDCGWLITRMHRGCTWSSCQLAHSYCPLPMPRKAKR